jgi:serine protease
MQRFLSKLLLVSSLFTASLVTFHIVANRATAQGSSNDNLYYMYYDQKIPLTARPDAIAVEFKSEPTTRSTRGGETPLYLQLQQDLQNPSRTRTRGPLPEVSPLGENYALVTQPDSQGVDNALKQELEENTKVKTTLPVVNRTSQNEALVVPNEIIVSFDTKTSEAQIQDILKRNNLEIVRPLRFNKGRYLVKSNTVTGTAILGVANQLHTLAGVKSAMPNFFQATAISAPGKVDQKQLLRATPKNQDQLLELNASPQTVAATRGTSSNQSQGGTLLPWQWYLNSTPMSECVYGSQTGKLNQCLFASNNQSQLVSKTTRADLRVTEAWQKTNGGQGAVVAVVDSVIQWDHPDLQSNIYQVRAVKDKLPGEISGWDFVSNDPDTRLNQAELAVVTPAFRDTFQLSDQELFRKYGKLKRMIKQQDSDISDDELASSIRQAIQGDIMGQLFHGTAVAGVIAASPVNGRGLVGVAPKAQILPVTVGKLGALSTAAIVEGIAYAAIRGADVINLSLSSRTPFPSEDMAEVIAEVQRQYPNLVIVAAAGNEESAQVGFPANLQGVLSVGATNLAGFRSAYSNFGNGLSVVAPGGEMNNFEVGPPGGILTTGGTWLSGFWKGISEPAKPWGNPGTIAADSRGKYVWIAGTSFSSPAVAGVVALMKGADSQRRLTRDRIISILEKTASYDSLALSTAEKTLMKQSKLPASTRAEQFFFGSGLVNAAAAVDAVQRLPR